ncbi:MAG: hypothetical protein BHW05_07445 [Clostridium sp. 42_12]|nr:MAG: hypothetical protein BHW05_07445 [Clostridium sp. 42_12]
MIILLVEDDTALAMGTTYALESEGMQVIHTTDCAQTRKVYGTDQKIDLVLLDVMLPDGDGFSLCEWLKGEQPDIPVIFLTALEDEGNVVHGLQYADDYITKPFRTKELIARIYANTRKYQKNISNLTETADDKITYYLSDSVDSKKMHKLSENMDSKKKSIFYLDEKNMQVYREGVPITLTPSEYRLFQTLYDHRGQILTREQLMEQLWSVDEAFVDDNTLSVYMRRLRQKIDLDQEKSCIATIRGVGYRMGEE